MLVTFDEKMRPMPVPVRVGAAVDVVGQAGKPKTITGKKCNEKRLKIAKYEQIIDYDIFIDAFYQ